MSLSEAQREKARAYYVKNRQRCNAASRRWYATHQQERVAHQQRYYAEHKDEAAKWQQTYKLNPEKRLLRLIGAARRRAKQFGLQFDEQIAAELGGVGLAKCACCNCEFDLASPSPGKRNFKAPSLDRKDNRCGYVSGNVSILCWRCNSLKSDASLDELRQIVAYMEQCHG